ncbi:MAG: hypothetical protein JXA21_23630 [Anaerolineae bacterium]|nr:hypothetical protein [Anaerolineae bacterium]
MNLSFTFTRKLFNVILLLCLLTALAACGSSEKATGKPTVVIASPADGSPAYLNQTLTIQAVAADANGIGRITLTVDGALMDTVSSADSAPSFSASLEWTPNTAGVHALVVEAYNTGDVASDPALIKVTVPADTAAGAAELPATIKSFEVTPDTINAGESAILKWGVVGADSAEIDQGIGAVALNGSRTVNPETTTTYQLTAHSAGGDIVATVQVTVQGGGEAPGDTAQKAVVQYFTAAPTAINAGESATLQWEVTGADSVEIDQGIGPVALNGSTAVNPVQTTTYLLTAHSAGGDAVATVMVTVQSAAETPLQVAKPVIVSFGATPDAISAGESATLQWEVAGATAVAIDQGIGVVAPSGSQAVTPADSTTYLLVAHSDGGDAAATAIVTVKPKFQIVVPKTIVVLKRGSWSDWEKLGGKYTYGPTVSSWGTNRLDVFVRGTNTHMMHRWWDGSNWSNWQDLGGELADAPACISWGANRIDCFVRGMDNELWHKWWDGKAWNGFEKLGGVFTAAPSVASLGENHLDVFVRGTNGHLIHKWWNGSQWSEWLDLGGGLADGPACASWGANRIDCFIRGLDNELWHNWWDGKTWSDWQKLGGVFTGKPAVASWGENRLDVFVRGTNTHLMTRYWDGQKWSDWADLAGELTDGPGCVSWGANRIDCCIQGKNDTELWHKWWGE